MAQKNRWHYGEQGESGARLHVALRRLDQVLNDAVVYDDADPITFTGTVNINPGPLIIGPAMAGATARLQIQAPSPPTFTTDNWRKSMELNNASVIKWMANAGGKRHFLGQTTGALYIGNSTADDGTGAPTYAQRWNDDASSVLTGPVIVGSDPLGTAIVRIGGNLTVNGTTGIITMGGESGKLRLQRGSSSQVNFLAESNANADIGIATLHTSTGNINRPDDAGIAFQVGNGTNTSFANPFNFKDVSGLTLLAQVTTTALTPGAAGLLTLGGATLGWGNSFWANAALLQWRNAANSASLRGVDIDAGNNLNLARDTGIPATQIFFGTSGCVFYDAATTTGRLSLNTTALFPNAPSGLALGTAALPWGTTYIGGDPGTTGVLRTLQSANAPTAIFYSQGLVNDVVGTVVRVAGGTDATLGYLFFDLEIKPSAAGASRYVRLRAGDNSAYRPIRFGNEWLEINSVALNPVTVGGLTLGTASLPWADIFCGTRLVFTGSAMKIVGGTVSLSLRNNADSADNLLIADAGDATLRTKLTMPGPLVLTTAASKIIPGATSLSHRNSADSADNLLINDAGDAHFRTTVDTVTEYRVNGTKVVGARQTGWGAWTGTADRTSKNTGTATLADCATAIKALIDDLRGGHGLLGA